MLPLTHPLPLRKAHAIHPSALAAHRGKTLAAKNGGGLTREALPALPVALLMPQMLTASAANALYMLLSRAPGAVFPSPFACTPPVLQLENLVKGVLFFNRVFGAAVLAFTGGPFETLLT